VVNFHDRFDRVLRSGSRWNEETRAVNAILSTAVFMSVNWVNLKRIFARFKVFMVTMTVQVLVGTFIFLVFNGRHQVRDLLWSIRCVVTASSLMVDLSNVV